LNHYTPIIDFQVHNFYAIKAEKLIKTMYLIFNMRQFTCLNINCQEMSVNVLIRILNALPNLNSIKIWDLPLRNAFNEYDEDIKLLDQIFERNKIRKLILQNITTMQQIDLIIDYLPRIQYFGLEQIRNVDLKSIVHHILFKIKQNQIYHPMTICICHFQVEYSQILILQQMIDSDNLLKNYTINCQYDRLYLQWKRFN
jgi:hypothetical protein